MKRITILLSLCCLTMATITVEAATMSEAGISTRAQNYINTMQYSSEALSHIAFQNCLRDIASTETVPGGAVEITSEVQLSTIVSGGTYVIRGNLTFNNVFYVPNNVTIYVDGSIHRNGTFSAPGGLHTDENGTDAIFMISGRSNVHLIGVNNAQLTGNWVTGEPTEPGTTAVYITGSNNVIVEGFDIGYVWEGLVARSNNDNIYFLKNYIHDTRKRAIWLLLSDYCEVVHNFVENAGVDGIDFDAFSYDNTAFENVVIGAGRWCGFVEEGAKRNYTVRNVGIMAFFNNPNTGWQMGWDDNGTSQGVVNNGGLTENNYFIANTIIEPSQFTTSGSGNYFANQNIDKGWTYFWDNDAFGCSRATSGSYWYQAEWLDYIPTAGGHTGSINGQQVLNDLNAAYNPTGGNYAPSWNNNPVVKNGATEELAYSSSLSGDATDPESDPLAYAKVSGPTWLSVASNGDLSGTPSNSDVGLNQWTVSVSDGTNTAVEALLQITVANVNDDPTFTTNPFSRPNAQATVAYSGTIAGSATDVDPGDTLTYTKYAGPAWLSVASDGALSGTPNLGDMGDNSFIIRVQDTALENDIATLNITVEGVPNDPPVWNSNPVVEANGEVTTPYTSSLVGDATDPESDPLSYAKVSGPTWLSVASNGALSGTPGTGDGGLNSWTVSVSDGNNPAVEATLNITINLMQAPYTGTPIALPGMVEAEAYDIGGEGLAYHDTSAGNTGGSVRTDDVDIEARDGGFNVGWTVNGEWLEYTVNTDGGQYDITFRVATISSGKQIELTLDGIPLCTNMVPNTGSWNVFQTATVSDIALPATSNGILRVRFIGGDVNLNWIEFIGLSSGYDIWAQQYAIEADGKTGDSDLDGVDNITEYMIDGNPTNSSEIGYMPNHNSAMELVYITADDPNISWYVLQSTNLMTGFNMTNTAYLGSASYTTGYLIHSNTTSQATPQLFQKVMYEYTE